MNESKEEILQIKSRDKKQEPILYTKQRKREGKGKDVFFPSSSSS